MTTLQTLHELGQSTWLNYLRNSFIRSGELAERVGAGVQGVTANALMYQRAIAASSDYDAAIRRQMESGTSVKVIHEALIADDIQRAADVLRPVFEAGNHRDGYVSVELDPAVLHDPSATVAEVRRVLHHIDRYNVMVEVPATATGVEAVRLLIADGVPVNATHIFSVETYERVAEAYIRGLEQYVSSHSVWRVTPTGVASFSLSPIDSAVDPLLDQAGRPDLKGKTALALSSVLYGRFREMFSGAAWTKLADKRGQPLRPKWTRTAPRDFELEPLHYVNRLSAPDTIMTFSTVTLGAFLRLREPLAMLEDFAADAETHLAELARLGIDLNIVSQQLQRVHLEASDRQFQALIQTVMRKRDELDLGWVPLVSTLGAYEDTAIQGIDELCRERILCRIWDHDYTVWQPKPTEITNRLGWLHVADVMSGKVAMLEQFTSEVLAEGFSQVLLLGMGGSSLAPELFERTFGRPSQPPSMPYSYLDLLVLDTTDADAVRAVEDKLDLAHTLIIVATKSGGTVETLSAFKYFYNRLADLVGVDRAGHHFVGITDPRSKITELAAEYRFRNVFLNDPNIGGRYSALSYFGLVPAALVGVNLTELLERASAMAANGMLCDCNTINENHAARLGAIMGKLAVEGRDKLTLVTSLALSSFGDWAEQLVAESLGKEGRGIVPIVGEPLAEAAAYGNDRLFVHMRLQGDRSYDAAVGALAAAGHPVVTLHLKDLYDIGGQFMLWELATAVAGYFLRVNPFDQPNVEEAKVKAREVVARYSAEGSLPTGDLAPSSAEALRQFLRQVRAGDYVAFQAYVPPTAATDKALLRLRERVRGMTGAATTVGYGPRFLHSTGQLHKGDRGNGLFVQFVSDAVTDVAIPDQAGAAESGISFDVLKKAQALGDAGALRDAGRRVLTLDVGEDAGAAIARLADEL